jgi:hypothetical protein
MEGNNRANPKKQKERKRIKASKKNIYIID